MKIAYIITGLGVGGAETALYRLLLNIDRSTFKPVVFSLFGESELSYKFSEIGVETYSLKLSTGIFGAFRFFYLVSLLKKINPDVVHTWMYHADLIGSLASRLAGIRKIVWCIRNGSLDPKLMSRITLIVVKLCAIFSKYLPQSIVCCSHSAMELHANAGYQREIMVVIPNGFSLEIFKPNPIYRIDVRREIGIDSNCLLIGLVARFHAHKNHAGFFEMAHNLIKNSNIPFQFVLVGEGLSWDNSLVSNYIASYGLFDNIHLLGRRDDISRLLASLDILVSTSITEAFPNVLGEAMACGVPCVVTNVGDCSYIVGSSGKVVDYWNAHDFASAVVDIANELMFDRERVASAARTRILSMFRLEDVVARYEALYFRIIDVK